MLLQNYKERKIVAKTRIVRSIENAFYAYSEQNVERVSFSQLKDWINSNTTGGISSPRLASFLRRNDQFKHLSRLRRIGSNIVETYWSLKDDVEVPAESGWVVVEDDDSSN